MTPQEAVKGWGRFEWGRCDCMSVLADWIAHVRGVDPVEHIRGQYHDALSCERLTGFVSDPVAAVQACLDTIGGLERVRAPQTGDIAVLLVATGKDERHACGLWMGAGWAVKGEQGATYLRPADVIGELAVWRVGYA